MRIGILAATAALFATSASAADLSKEHAWRVLLVAQRSGGPLTIESVIATLTRPLRIFDTGRDGLDRADIEKVLQLEQAGLRASALGGLLSADLNNDRQITREEFELASRASSLLVLKQPNFIELDDNGDDVLDWSEMSKSRLPRSFGDRDPPTALIEELPRMDPGQDGVFTVDDATTLAAQVMTMVDSDRNGLVSSDEISALVNERRDKSRRPR